MEPLFVTYADGSRPNNRTVGPDNPADWGFAAYVSNSPFDKHLEVTNDWHISHGMVKTAPLDENVLAPLDGSNNTGGNEGYY